MFAVVTGVQTCALPIYNLSSQGPILPLGSSMLGLTPISPFRPRRWRGAIVPDKARIGIRVLNPEKRPVSAVADQREVREVAQVDIAIDRARDLTLLFDPEHAPDDRITMEPLQNGRASGRARVCQYV